MWNESVFFAILGVRMYGRNRKRNILYKRDGNFRIFFPRTDHRNVLEFFATFGKIQKKTIKMYNHQRFDDGMRLQIE